MLLFLIVIGLLFMGIGFAIAFTVTMTYAAMVSRKRPAHQYEGTVDTHIPVNGPARPQMKKTADGHSAYVEYERV